MLLKVGRTVHPGSWSGTSFRNKRPCRLSPAHQGMKIKVLIVGVVCGSFATHTPLLDSRLRGNDEGVAGIAMALRGPRERMKNGGAPGILGWEEAPALRASPPLDSGPVSGYGACFRPAE